ncbi:hypothetical protein LC040_08995 [Bacillus tianshenii]|nr:hypothetical protein LC040_08995 [Bacillus tianshenii]
MRKYVFVIKDQLSDREECVEAGGMLDAFQQIHKIAAMKEGEFQVQLKGVIY